MRKMKILTVYINRISLLECTRDGKLFDGKQGALISNASRWAGLSIRMQGFGEISLNLTIFFSDNLI